MQLNDEIVPVRPGTTTMKPSRRKPFGLLSAPLLRAARTEPELLLFNGNIHTMDPANPKAQAIAIADQAASAGCRSAASGFALPATPSQ